jgi:uncharacterized membrane protein YdbT with pleckstrin-like domain
MDDLNIPTNPVVKTSEWVLTILITAIPLVGFIMLFVWAFGSGTNPSKANWAKAALIWMVIGLVAVILWTVLFGVAFMNAMQ